MKFARGEGVPPQVSPDEKRHAQMMMNHSRQIESERRGQRRDAEHADGGAACRTCRRAARLKFRALRSRRPAPQMSITWILAYPEQQLLQSTLRDFSKRELEPQYESRDRDADLPPDWCGSSANSACSHRWCDPRLAAPALDYVSLGIAHEEIARGDFNAAYVLLIAALVGADRRAQRRRTPTGRRICRRSAAANLSRRSP